MKSCEHSELLVSSFLDGELDGPIRREVASRVAGCANCTRQVASIERIHEIICQSVDDAVEQVDFSRFWSGVADRLGATAPSMWVRFRLWLYAWRASVAVRGPRWAVATGGLFVMGLFVFSETGPGSTSLRVAVATNDQAHIESLSSPATVFLWNEPINNTTVIWVGDHEGGTKL